MSTLSQYLFCLITAVVLCGIIQILIPGEKNSLIQLVVGVAVAVVAAVAAAIIIKKKRKSNKNAEDEDEDI